MTRFDTAVAAAVTMAAGVGAFVLVGMCVTAVTVCGPIRQPGRCGACG